MEPDLAAEAVESMQAAPVAGADHEKEREKSALLQRMDGGEGEDPGAPVGEEGAVGLAEPVAEGEGGEEAPAEDPEEAVLAEGRRKAHAAVSRDFPEVLVEGSELANACREEMDYLREAGSPLADDPEAEYKIARRMSRLLGGRRAVPEPRVKARRSVRPLPTGGALVESSATALERRVANAKSTGDMLGLLREIGTPFEALLRR